MRLRNTSLSDIGPILYRIRRRDLDCLEAHGPPIGVLTTALCHSVVTYTVLYNEVPAVVFGVRQPALLDNRAYVWMVGTTLIDDAPIVFLRGSKRLLTVLRLQYSEIYGHIEYDYEASIRWLRWLGAEIRQDGGQLLFRL